MSDARERYRTLVFRLPDESAAAVEEALHGAARAIALEASLAPTEKGRRADCLFKIAVEWWESTRGDVEAAENKIMGKSELRANGYRRVQLAGYRCEICRHSGCNRDASGVLDIHHLLSRESWRQGVRLLPTRDALAGLAVLCRSCHDRIKADPAPEWRANAVAARIWRARAARGDAAEPIDAAAYAALADALEGGA